MKRTMGSVRSGLLRRPATAVLSGVLLTLAFPPLGWWPVAWIALAPWYGTLVADSGPEHPRRNTGWVGGFLLGFSVFLVGMVWMNEIGTVPWLVLSAIQAVPFALLGALCARFLPRCPLWMRPLIFAALWTLFEGVRSWGRYAFPWFLLAATQVRAPSLVQIVAVTGQWGLSFALALGSALLAEAWLSRNVPRVAARCLAGAAAVITALGAWGVFVLRGAGDRGRPVRTVAVAQGSILKMTGGYEAYRAAMLGTYADLTRAAARAGADLVAWPETVVPRPGLLRDPVLFEPISRLARTFQTPILAGSAEVDSENRLWNAAILLDRNGVPQGRYDKTQLVPVGEFFPLRGLLGPIYAQYGVTTPDFMAGSGSGVLPLKTPPERALRLGLIICYESAFGRHAAERTRQGADALVLLTSDQAFGTTAGPYQHADLSILRAVETRRWVVRAASTGISEIVDPWGRIHSRLGINRRGVLVGRIHLRSDLTPYARWGDWFLGVCALVVVAALFIRRGRDASGPVER